MRLAVFFPHSHCAAWCLTEGLCETLERMGHEVSPNKIILNSHQIDREFYPVSLDDMDAVIISGPEWIGRHFKALYPKKVKPLKLAWLHESVEREDYGKLDVEVIKGLADIVFCPAEQDKKFGFEYLPFGVDMAMFKPSDYTFDLNTRSYPLIFIGNIYEKRKKFLDEFLPELAKQGVEIKIGNCLVQDLDGVNIRKSVQLYADTLRNTRVFLNLPALSNLIITKIYEVVACGAILLNPDNSFYYAFSYSSPKEAAHQAAALLSKGSELSRYSSLGVEEMWTKHRLELRLQKMLTKVQI